MGILVCDSRKSTRNTLCALARINAKRVEHADKSSVSILHSFCAMFKKPKSIEPIF